MFIYAYYIYTKQADERERSGDSGTLEGQNFGNVTECTNAYCDLLDNLNTIFIEKYSVRHPLQFDLYVAAMRNLYYILKRYVRIF